MWNTIANRIVSGVTVGASAIAKVFARGGREYKWESKHRGRTKMFILAVLSPLFILHCIVDARTREIMELYLNEVP